MTCEHVTLSNGVGAIVCSSHRRQRSACGRRATQLCDWMVPTRRSGTCNAPICTDCATSPAPDKNLCRKHAAAWRERQAARASRVVPS